ncbi:MAG: TonB-dependent receptor [Spongiibacteraceae bacterium]|nr:TonB-dependent receptor [Spongiibacteraceae bacterium]
MRFLFSRRHSLFVSSLSVLLTPVFSWGADFSLLEEVMVTAQKRDQSIEDIGMSISAYTGDQLDALGFSETADMANLVPGLTLAKSFQGTPIYTLRGVGFNTPNLSSTSPVGIYYDEVSYAYPVMANGLGLDLERIEVLKGPQGTLYGRNTTGGLVNHIAHKPSEETEISVKLSAGKYDSYGFETVIGGALSDSVFARFAYSTDQAEEGWQKSVSHGERLGEVDRSAARLSLLFNPVDSVEVLLTGSWWEDKSQAQAAQSIEVYPEALIDAGVPESDWLAVGQSLGIYPQIFDRAYTPTKNEDADWVISPIPWGGNVGGQNYTEPELLSRPNDTSMFSLALRADWNINEAVAMTSITSYSDYERDEMSDPSGWNIENFISNDRGSIKSFSQELRFSGETDSMKWIGGFFYSNDETIDNTLNWGATYTALGPLRTFVGSLSLDDALSPEQEDIIWGFRDWENLSEQDITTKAVFGQIEYTLTDSLNLTAGLRYTEDEAEFVACSRDQGDNSIAATWNGFFNNVVGIPADVAPGGCVTYQGDLAPSLAPGGPAFPEQGLVRKSLHENNVSGRLALDWAVDESTLIYASVARGFKSGAFPNLDANVAIQYEPATQEEVLAYEIGSKLSPIESVQLNASAYYYDYKDKQVYGGVEDIIFIQLNRVVNVPESSIQGAELEVSWAPTDALTFYVSGSYMKTEIEEYVGFNNFGVLRDFSGGEFSYSPEFQFNSFVSYGFSIGDSMSGRFTLDANYSGEQQADLESDERFAIDSYTLFGAHLGITSDDEKWEAQAFVRNITDEYYWKSVVFFTDSISRYSGMPRTYGLSLKYNFL